MPLLNVNERLQMDNLLGEGPVSTSRYVGTGVKPGKISSLNTDDFIHGEHTQSVLSEDFSSFKNGQPNPRYMAQILGLVDATTPYSAEYHRIKANAVATVGFTSIMSGYYGKKAFASWDPKRFAGHYTCTFPNTSMDSTLRTLCAQKFYSKMAAPFQGSTFLGELAATVRMLRRPVVAFRRALTVFLRTQTGIRNRTLREFKRNRLGKKHARKVYRRAAAASWLEFQWGVRPLMSDISSAYAALRTLLQAPQVQHFSASVSMDFASAKTELQATGLYWSLGDLLIQGYHETGVRYTGAVYSRSNVSSSLATELSVAPLDWVPAAWELLPYSWLADYFFNIGEILSAVVTSQRIRYVYCCENVRYKSTFRLDLTPRPIPKTTAIAGVHYTDWRSDPGYTIAEKFRLVRNKISSVPIPSLTLHSKLDSAIKQLNLGAFGYLKGEGIAFKNRHRL